MGEDLETIRKGFRLEGASMVLRIGSGSLTIRDAIGTEIKLIDDRGNTAVINPNDYIDKVLNIRLCSDYLNDWIHPNADKGVKLYSEAVLKS